MNVADLRKQFDRLDPNQYVTFKSKAHDQRIAAVLGIALGVTFFTCFITGLISHVMQHPPSWYTWPANPAGFYRVTQGVHVASGILAIPILFAKLWVIFPKLFEWPPIESVAHLLERASLPPLIGGGIFMLLTGVANINQWYFFPFFFTNAHYAVAWITIGALIIHIGAKGAIARNALRKPDAAAVSATVEQDENDSAVTRRGFLWGTFGTGALLTLFTVGQSFTPLGKLALLAPRRPHVGPQGLPVNRTALGAGVIEAARSSEYRLVVEGAVGATREFSLTDLKAMPQHSAELPIACVEGWSQSAHWSGVRVRDLLDAVGARRGASVRVQSIENGLYAQSVLNRYHASDEDTLLALQLNGEPLDIDHGYPCRLIGPNRPGVLQTKWVNKLVVL